MWIFLNDSFISVVQKPGDVTHLTVRGRVKGDIEAVFPEAHVVEGGGTDYRFRALIPREVVADRIASRLMELSYANFKSSVDEDDRHDAYMEVWDVMYRYQTAAMSGDR